MKTDLNKIQEEIDNGYIISRPSGTGLTIYNYSKECQYEGHWNDITMMCRGLILDEDGNIIARGFPKFFNWEELKSLNISVPNLQYEVFIKMDGSLLISYIDKDENFKVASRGSFDSEQAKEGNKILQEKYPNVVFNEEITYLFELIAPWNRIVVDYGVTRDVFLLAMIDNRTGQDIPLENAPEGLKIVKKYGQNISLEKLKNLNIQNEEGFVIKYSNGFRMKIKFEDYVRLHRIMTGINKKTVWEILKDSDLSLDEYLKDVPEEFSKWIYDTKNELEKRYKEIEENCLKILEEINKMGLSSRKEIALNVMKKSPKEYAGIVFNILDKKDYSKQIWKIIKPSGQESFSKDEMG